MQMGANSAMISPVGSVGGTRAKGKRAKGERGLEEALGGVVGALRGGGEVRPGQLQMAEAVARAIGSGRHLAVRAGTGTGKSLAYLVPAVLARKRVLIATATKNLQDQLARKDLPLVHEHLGQSFEHAVLKGRSNYLCVQAIRESAASSLQGELGTDLPSREAPQRRRGEVEALLAWAATTGTGDRAELEEEPDPRLWSAFSVTAEECPGAQRCPSGGSCFVEAARARAAEADVVVVNLHLLGADLASGGEILPERDVVVVDEAHELEDVMSASLGISLSASRVRAAALSLRTALGAPSTRDAASTEPSSPGLEQRAGLAGRSWRGAPERGSSSTAIVESLLQVGEDLERVLSTEIGRRLTSTTKGPLGDVLALLESRLERAERELRRSHATDGLAPSSTKSQMTDAGAKTQADGEEGVPTPAGDGGQVFEQRRLRALTSIGHLRDDLHRIASLEEDQVAWVEGGAQPSLEVAPIDVSGLLAELLFGRGPVVLTSATLPPGLLGQLGAGEERSDELDVGSPFAYEEKALLYCAAHLPDRRRPEAEAAIHDEITALVTASSGRALVLFTSRSAMERAAEVLRSRISLPILVQGERSKVALLAEFGADPAASLFATMGFWQGVDVPGPTLSLVVIDRIPFPRPDEPLTSARRERAGPAGFRVVDLPRAASLLAQGAGRLIRSAEDRGVVAILDSRLASASYRWDLVRALPPMRRTKDRGQVEELLSSLHAEAARQGR